MTQALIYGCMPLRGGAMHGASAVSFWRFVRDTNLDFTPQDRAFNEDVYRVRSRLARLFLAAKHASGQPYTHLFFLDSDVSCAPITLQRLVEANKPVICAPYPKKHHRLKREDGSQAYEPTWYPTGPQDGLFQPALVPMGCTLIERSVIERVSRECVAAFEVREHAMYMVANLPDSPERKAAYAALEDSATVFGDVVDNVVTPHIFGQIVTENPIHPEHPPNAWPEDMSFCLRCNRLGIPTVMHMGTEAYHHEGGVMFPDKAGQ